MTSKTLTRIVASVPERVSSRMASSESKVMILSLLLFSSRILAYSSSEVDVSTLLTFSSADIVAAISVSEVSDVPGLK